MTTTSKLFSMGLCVSILALGACSSSSVTGTDNRQSQIDNAMARAGSNALRKGNTSQALSILEKAYQKDNQDPEIATKYAEALRKSGQAEKAGYILESFANAQNPSLETLIEYASVEIENGNNKIAEKFARKAVERDSNASEAHHLLAISLDGLERYEEAEASYRTALDMWEGDPVPIMNNLALNLSYQKRIQDSVDILKKAKSIAPNRIEIERNLRIISTLNEDPKEFLGD